MIGRRLYRSFILTFALICSFVVVATDQASAATNQGPNPDDFTQSSRYGNDYVNVPRYVDFVVATSAYNAIPTTRVKIYMPTPTGSITINNKNICYGTFRNGGRNFDLPDDGNLNGASGSPVSYSIPGGGATQLGSWDGASNCDSKSITFNVSGAAVEPNTGMYLYVLTATANSSAARYMNTFWVVAPAGSIVSNDSTLAANNGFGMNQTWPIADNNNPSSDTPPPPAPYRNFTNYSIKFGPDCTVTQDTFSKPFQIYDDDNNSVSSSDNWAVQPGRFRIGLREIVRGQPPSTGIMINPTSISTPGGWRSMGSGFYEVYTSGSNKTSTLNYPLRKDRVYEWILDSVFQDNTLQFKIPFDNIYYYRECQTNNYNLQPIITPTASTVEVGDTLGFDYDVNNTGSGPSPSTVGCSIYGKSFTGYHDDPSSGAELTASGYVPAGSFAAPATGCPRAFPSGNTNLATEAPFTVTAAMANTSICRALYVNPGAPGGGAVGDEVCVQVISRPYSRVYGGDVVAGGGVITSSNTCTMNTGAAVIGWNRRGANGYSGAGVQHAIFAMNTIYDTSTTLGNGGGSGAAPAGLAFANTSTDATNGRFGGNFGSVPCIPDYYAGRATAASPASIPASLSAALAGLGSQGSYVYAGTGNFTLNGGVVRPGYKVTVYVDGNVYITGPIAYGGTWSSSTIPMFRLIVSGNIYVDNDVAQLDGLYVAQPDGGGADGVIATCTTGAALPTLGGTLASDCDNSTLVVNGGFVAKQVYLLRTKGSQRASSVVEPSNANIAEVFNYNPMLWISQPETDSESADYDAINSLPPTL